MTALLGHAGRGAIRALAAFLRISTLILDTLHWTFVAPLRHKGLRVRATIEQFVIIGFEDYLPSELSGGMKKRAGLARAMAMDPQVIFYDEPSAGLDPIVVAGLDMLICKLKTTFGLTSVVVTHELPSVEVVADRVCLLHRGKVAALGTLAEVNRSFAAKNR